MTKNSKWDLIVNKVRHDWAAATITGREIKALAGSPPDYVVNQIVAGPNEDPVVLDDQTVDLSNDAEPRGQKRFITRKPTTTPGQ